MEKMVSFILVYGNLEIVKYLFEKNCGINQIDNHGTNGFIYACSQGHHAKLESKIRSYFSGKV